MWKILLFVLCLSVDAQRFKFNNKIFGKDSTISNSHAHHHHETHADGFTFRLPNNTKPEYYSIFLNIANFDESVMSFTGRVLIEIRVLENTNTITLHSAVSVTTTRLSNENDLDIPHDAESYENDEREFFVITTSTTLQKDMLVRLYINYEGTISSEFEGIFAGSYQEGDQTRYFVATQSQPTFFRRICPSFDEPAFKAQFQLGLQHSSDYTAISNSQVSQRVNLGDGTAMTIFQITTLLPTYLVAFVISNFEHSILSTEKSLFRAYSRAEQIPNTQFCLETGVRALELYESAFETKYELEKLDQVALPVFYKGAMENHGIIFYREDLMLVDPSVATAVDKELVALTIVHEICHKFLGNLLTPSWWHVVWLSEGFCRFYEYYMTEKIYPDMRTAELFAVAALQNVLRKDASWRRPMTWYQESPEAVAELFDHIAYSKSASVIGMFLHSLSEQTFHKGLKIYLSKSTSNPEGVAKPQHLYEALQKAADEDGTLASNYSIADLFGSWEKQTGFPVVFVLRSYNNRHVRFTQNRFTNSIADGEVWDKLWHIPITFSSKANPTIETKPKFWLSSREIEIELTEVGPDSYFLVNLKQTGYYRVQYDEANWMLIANELSHGNFSAIPPNSRAMLIDDAAVFVESDILQIRILLELIKYLEHDIDYIPWLAATNNLEYIWRMVDDGRSKLSADFQKFLRVLVVKSYNTFGAEEVEGEPHYRKHSRNMAINWACQAHLEACINGTRDKLHDFIARKRVQISKDHEASIFCNGNVNADENEFESLWLLYNNSAQPDRRRFYLKSMGCIENEEILTRLIRTIIESTDIDNTNNEWFTIVKSVYSNGPIGLGVVLDFLRSDYDEMIGLINDLEADLELEELLLGISERVNTRELSAKLIQILDIYNIEESTVDDIKTTVAKNLEWIEKHSADIQEFLDDFFRSGSSTTIFSCFIIVFGLAFNWIMQN